MSKLIQAPPKFTHGEWTHSNHSNYNSAEKQRASAERLIDESDRLIDETEESTKKTQRDVNKKFGKEPDSSQPCQVYILVECWKCNTPLGPGVDQSIIVEITDFKSALHYIPLQF